MEHLRITVAGTVYDVTVEKTDANESDIAAAPVRAAAPAAAVRLAPTPKAPAAAPGDATSPLAGIVQAIEREIGSTVNQGDLVITLEAMKMYTAINAPSAGTITAIHVKVGDAVEEGQALYTIG
jgi:biotin carboxyl carrier protein